MTVPTRDDEEASFETQAMPADWWPEHVIVTAVDQNGEVQLGFELADDQMTAAKFDMMLLNLRRSLWQCRKLQARGLL